MIRHVAAPESIQVATYHCKIGDLLYQDGKKIQALDYYKRALQAAQPTASAHPDVIKRLYEKMAKALKSLRDEQAAQSFRRLAASKQRENLRRVNSAESFGKRKQFRVIERSNSARSVRHTDEFALDSFSNGINGRKGTNGTKRNMLRIILLLTKPGTSVFELLQLEFHPIGARVSDVLAQIPKSITEDALRKVTYTRICGDDGTERTPQVLLSTFCTGSEVLVAIPQGMPASECACVAKFILNDTTVAKMVRFDSLCPIFRALCLLSNAFIHTACFCWR